MVCITTEQLHFGFALLLAAAIRYLRMRKCSSKKQPIIYKNLNKTSN